MIDTDVNPDSAQTAIAPAAAVDAPVNETSADPVFDSATEGSLLGDAPDSEAAPLDDAAVNDAPQDDSAPAAETDKADAAAVEGDAAASQTDEASQSDDPAPLPTYEAFSLPEGFQADEATLGEFSNALGEIELAKGDHAKLQEVGQKLLDQHIAAVQEAGMRLTDYYTAAWEKQRSDWKDSFEKDPEIGGNRRDTTLLSAKNFIRAYAGNDDQRKELVSVLDQTGLGNHPALIRLLAKAGESLTEGKPVPASKPFSAPTSKIAKRYGTNT